MLQINQITVDVCIELEELEAIVHENDCTVLSSKAGVELTAVIRGHHVDLIRLGETYGLPIEFML